MSRVVVAPFVRARRRQVAFLAEPPAPVPPASRRPSGPAQALALAHHLERDIVAARLPGQAEAARLLGLTRSRLTQLAQLTQLAPDLQVRVIHSETVDGREPPYTQRALRHVAAALSWSEQRERFARVSGRTR